MDEITMVYLYIGIGMLKNNEIRCVDCDDGIVAKVHDISVDIRKGRYGSVAEAELCEYTFNDELPSTVPDMQARITDFSNEMDGLVCSHWLATYGLDSSTRQALTDHFTVKGKGTGRWSPK